MILSLRISTLMIVTTSTLVTPCWSANLFQHDDFEDGTRAGWSGAANPINIPTGGPAGDGDAFLQITSNGTTGPGSRLATNNARSEWSGDFFAVGAQRISIDFLNTGAMPFEMRVALIGPDLDNRRWTSTAAHVVPTDGTWSTYEFFLFESELTQVLGVVPYGELMQDVLKVVVRHDEGDPSSDGTAIADTLGIDNVRLLPGGDFDNDGIVNLADVDALVAAIAAGNNPNGFDLDGDAAVDGNDLSEWLRLAGHLAFGPGNSYLPGDTNLDGSVDVTDFNNWNANKFTNTAAWSAGDFNADGSTDVGDFNIWNNNKFTSTDVDAVPEPSAAALMLCGLLALLLQRKLGVDGSATKCFV